MSTPNLLARLKRAPYRAVAFPLAEGLGVFVGVLAWDLLNTGRIQTLKALSIAIPCTIVWFAVRCWKASAKKRP